MVNHAHIQPCRCDDCYRPVSGQLDSWNSTIYYGTGTDLHEHLPDQIFIHKPIKWPPILRGYPFN
jgi:hypothetical protein